MASVAALEKRLAQMEARISELEAREVGADVPANTELLFKEYARAEARYGQERALEMYPQMKSRFAGRRRRRS